MYTAEELNAKNLTVLNIIYREVTGKGSGEYKGKKSVMVQKILDAQGSTPAEAEAEVAVVAEAEVAAAPVKAPRKAKEPKEPKPRKVGIKTQLRTFLEEGGVGTLDEIAALLGSTRSAVATHMSDLRNPKYAGGEVLDIVRHKTGEEGALQAYEYCLRQFSDHVEEDAEDAEHTAASA